LALSFRDSLKKYRLKPKDIGPGMSRKKTLVFSLINPGAVYKVIAIIQTIVDEHQWLHNDAFALLFNSSRVK